MNGAGAWSGAFALPFGVALALSLCVTPLVRRLALRGGLVARPSGDRWSSRTVPLLGGLSIWLSTLAAATVTGAFSPETVPVAIGGAVLFALGLIDDVLRLRPSTKLPVEIALACAAVAYGMELHWTHSPVVNGLLTVFWLVGVTNAFNLLDNMDGLCAGISIIAAIAFCASVGASDPALLAYAATIAGATLGFLVFNFNPASMFLGDAGSLFLGGSFALLTLAERPAQQTGLVSTLVAPVVILLIPIFDTAFVTISRKLSARAASQGGRDHTSHRLVAIGFSEKQAVLLLYALAAISGSIGVGMSRANVESFGLGLLLMVGIVLFGVQLARVRVYDGDDFSVLRNRRYTPLLVRFTYRRRVFEVLLDTCLISSAYYLAYAVRFADNFKPVYYGLFVRSLPVVIACQLAGFIFAGVYRGVWRYITVSDLVAYGRGVLFGTVLMLLSLLYLFRFAGYSRSVFIIYALIVAILVVGARLAFRSLSELTASKQYSDRTALVYGAGDGGAMLVRELRSNRQHDLRPIGFIDDDEKKHARHIMGLPVVGAGDNLSAIIRRYRPNVILVSTAKIGPRRLARLQMQCAESGISLGRMRFGIDDISEPTEPVWQNDRPSFGDKPREPKPS